MNVEEAVKVVRILNTADSGCIACVEDLLKEFIWQFGDTVDFDEVEPHLQDWDELPRLRRARQIHHHKDAS